MANAIYLKKATTKTVCMGGVFDVSVPFTFEGEELTPTLVERIKAAFRGATEKVGSVLRESEGVLLVLQGIEATGPGVGTIRVRKAYDAGGWD